MAAFALAEACAVRKAQGEPDVPKLRNAAVKAIEFIEEHQHNDGGWRYTTEEARAERHLGLGLGDAGPEIGQGGRASGQPGDAGSNALLLQVVRDGRRPDRRIRPASGASSDALTAVGMLTHLLLLKERMHPW